MDETALYSFFSTFAQSVAALVGLSATFAVLSYQDKMKQIHERSAKISGAFRGNYRVFLSKDILKMLRDSLDDEVRALHLRQNLKKLFSNETQALVLAHAKSTAGDPDQQLEEYMAWEDEFKGLDQVRHELKKFCNQLLSATTIGFILIAASLAAITATAGISHWEKDYQLIVLSFFIGGLFFYLKFLIGSLQLAFRPPRRLNEDERDENRLLWFVKNIPLVILGLTAAVYLTMEGCTWAERGFRANYREIDSCLDGGGCWDQSARKCRSLDDPTSQPLCEPAHLNGN